MENSSNSNAPVNYEPQTPVSVDMDAAAFSALVDASAKLKEKKTLRSKAGKIGMANRWNNNVITNDNTPITEYNKGKEIKGNEIKVKEINISFDAFWLEYDKKVGDRNKLTKKWENLSDEERIKAIEHIKV